MLQRILPLLTALSPTNFLRLTLLPPQRRLLVEIYCVARPSMELMPLKLVLAVYFYSPVPILRPILVSLTLYYYYYMFMF